MKLATHGLFQLFLLLLLAVIAAGLTGCASTAEPENQSYRPWGAPQGWESGLPTSLTEGR
mgnify:CR=1 FL=1